MNIQNINNELLEKLLQLKEVDPSFTFWLRRKKDGLENGQWFQGSGNYISVGLLRTNSGNLSTKSFALQIDLVNNSIHGSLVLYDRKFDTSSLKDFYLELSKSMVEVKPRLLWERKLDSSNGLTSIINDFWNFYPSFQNLVNKHKIEKDQLIDHDDFQKSLSKVERYKQLLKNNEHRSKMNPKFWIYAPGEQAKMWPELYDANEMAIAWDEIGNLSEFNSKLDVENALNHGIDSKKRKTNDALACFEFSSEIKKGDVIIAKKGKKEYIGWGIVISDYYFDDTKSSYKNRRGVSWKNQGEWIDNNGDIVLKTLTDITKYPDYVDRLSKLLNIQLMNDSRRTSPLNQILYGPPGTGKTFNTIDTAISIVNPQFDLKKERKELLEEYHRLVKTGNIVFTTFHQSMSYEDFIEGIKPLKSDSGDSVMYDVEAGLFKIACANAGYFCYQKSLENDKKQHKYTFDDLYDSFIEYYQELLENGTEFSFKTLTGKEVTIIHINSNDSIQARALHSTATKKPAPLTKENLQKLYDRFSSVEEISTLSQVQETVEVTPRTTEFYAVFKGLKEYEKTIFKPEEIESIAQIEVLDEKDKLKKFDAGVFKEAIKANSRNAEKVVMIIDEINRGNISAIFGELITLIEESKRLGKDEFLEITLPYSKKKFSVPANLYIIGTMNTADRSVEALDTALRRRFSFVEMLPNPERLKDKGEDKNGNVGSINLPELLSVINDRIEVLVDRDHTIGHAFFMDVKSIEDLKHVFADKIIPLLQEYFYGNYAKMEMVLGPNFFDEKNGNKPIQFAVQNNNIEVSETNYKLKNIHDDSFDLEKALKRLLNTSDPEVEKAN